MTNEKKQQEIVESVLLKHKRISRNWCIQNYITCLAQIILKIKKDKEWEIEGNYFLYINKQGKKCKDFVYTLYSEPKQSTMNI